MPCYLVIRAARWSGDGRSEGAQSLSGGRPDGAGGVERHESCGDGRKEAGAFPRRRNVLADYDSVTDCDSSRDGNFFRARGRQDRGSQTCTGPFGTPDPTHQSLVQRDSAKLLLTAPTAPTPARPRREGPGKRNLIASSARTSHWTIQPKCLVGWPAGESVCSIL